MALSLELIKNPTELRSISAGRDNAMNRGPEVAVGREFQRLADIDDEGAWYGHRVDSAAVVLHLQAAPPL